MEVFKFKVKLEQQYILKQTEMEVFALQLLPTDTAKITSKPTYRCVRSPHACLLHVLANYEHAKISSHKLHTVVDLQQCFTSALIETSEIKGLIHFDVSVC